MNTRRRPRARNSRTKAKKPKFLSLRLQFPAEEAVQARRIGASPAADSKSHGLNLFPLHPENQDRESTQDQENVAYFFSATDAGATTTLTGLLDDSADTPSISSQTTSNNSNRLDDLSPSSASLTYTCGGTTRESKDGSALVRNAMRNRERDSSEEKWVCYSEVVERRKIKEEEVTSSALDPRLTDDRAAAIQGLSLKLDYQEILKAWSNKGPLYVDASNSQVVPDMSHDFLLQESSYNVMGWGCNEVKMGLWAVPETGQREASVLRYKEKRRNRLFSKKIRYQVRKLNAEKRPRLKGRFVKRS